MNMYQQEIVTHLPPGLPERIGLRAFSSDQVAILAPKLVFAEPKGFDCYKFLIHAHSNPPYVINKKSVVVQKKHLFPINPAQAHGAASSGVVPQYLAIFINKAFLQEVAYEMQLSRDIFFNNMNYRLTPAVQELINTFIHESVCQQKGYRFILEGITYQLTVNLLRHCKHNLYKSQTHASKTSNKAIQRAIDFLNAHYTQDFNLEDIANTVCYSSFHFLRLFKEHTGQTPFQYLQTLKLEKAIHLLQSTDKSITDICYDIGYNNRSYFSTAFKRKYGVSPLHYRKLR